MGQHQIDRRQFLAVASATLAAPLLVSCASTRRRLPPSEQTTIGMIGTAYRPYSGDPDSFRSTEDGVSEFLRDAGRTLPSAGLSMDRLSCHRFLANFWRLLLHVAAYNLLNAFRDSDEIPASLRHAQPHTPLLTTGVFGQILMPEARWPDPSD